MSFQKGSYLFLLILLFVVLSGCSKEERIANHYFLTLTGESASWKVEKYEISLTPEQLKAGDGIVTMKGKSNYQSKDFGLDVHAVINNEDTVIQGKYVTGSETNIASLDTGGIEGGTYFDQEGKPIELDDISRIYMTIQWHDAKKDKKVKETIELYN